MDKDESDKKASFMERFIAFMIDVLLVSFVASFIAVPFVDSASVEKLNDEMVEVSDMYLMEEIDVYTYLSESSIISHKLARSNGSYSFITICIEVLYFIVFQLYNKGQTLGKMMMKIRVKSKDDDLTMNQMIYRTFIINSILYSFINFALMIFASSSAYFYGVLLFELVQISVILISAGMIIFTKENNGLHDLITNTRVVRVN